MPGTCSENLFCANLPEDVRGRLCANCRQQVLKAGSFRLHESFGRAVTVILDGVISDVPQAKPEDAIDESTMPFFTLCFPGRPLSLDFTFFSEDDVMANYYQYNGMTCLTDCCIATFDHAVFRELYDGDRRFAKALMQISLASTSDAAQFSAIMRSESVYAKLVLLIRKLMAYDLYLPGQEIADVLACNRASITRAFAKLKDEDPELLAGYLSNKGREITLIGAPRRHRA